jgi:hypothetical protein
MTDYGFVCRECGRTFRGISSRIGEEMCPQCGGIDIERAALPAPTTPTAPPVPSVPDQPDRGEEPAGPQQQPSAAEGV